jgi:magnesium-protoporphyrin O-methyltransferase
MLSVSYIERRHQVEDYFDRTAVESWSRLTSDVPVGRIRATVRAGREEMRRTLLSWLPADLRDRRVLDAGCGTGALAVEAARRGARVVAVDLSPTLIALACERAPRDLGHGSVTFLAGDMLEPALGRFDHVIGMDSLIHYGIADAITAVAGLAARTRNSLLFTYVPRTPALAVMHTIGRAFPRSNRAPSVQPVAQASVRRLLSEEPTLAGWRTARSVRIARGFYTSQAVELVAS